MDMDMDTDMNTNMSKHVDMTIITYMYYLL